MGEVMIFVKLVYIRICFMSAQNLFSFALTAKSNMAIEKTGAI